MSDSNPLEITEFRNEDGESRMYIPLDKLSEEIVEQLRAQYLQTNSVDSDAEEIGPSAPGVKDDAAEQAAEVFDDALKNPVGEGDEKAVSPGDVLG